MFKRIIDFIRSRPTETWLGLWTAIVGLCAALGLVIDPVVVSAVAAVIGWVVTFIASRPTNTLGPQ